MNLLRRAYATNPRAFDQFYRYQLFANEVMLMPYYIASLNIEHEYYALTGKYEPFDGICFVDTLDLAEGLHGRQLDMFMTERNTERVERQKKAPITVILGNPPYNVGQLNENDNNKNRTYSVIDRRVAETFGKDSKASSKSKLNDPYVKFFRWAADRLQGRDGVVCYVSNNSFVDQIAFDGMRKHLLEDFTCVYHLDLHGNVRQNPKLSGTTHNVFGIQVGVGITVAVRSAKHENNPLPASPKHGGGANAQDSAFAPLPVFGEGLGVGSIHMEQQSVGTLLYHRVPEFWTRYEKLAYLTQNVNLDTKQNSLNTVEWQKLTPDNRYTWLVPKNADEYERYLPLGSKETKSAKTADVETIFKLYSLGVSTNRDEVVYNFNKSELLRKAKQFIDDYNAEVDRYRRSTTKTNVDQFVQYDKLKWSGTLKLNLQRGKYAEFDDKKSRLSVYRPFTKRYLFYDEVLNERPREFSHIFSTPSIEQENRIIWLKIGSEWPMFALISNSIVDLLPQGGSQCFPFYTYDEDGTNRRENITDWALAQFRARYNNPLPTSPKHGGGANTQDSALAPLPVFGEGLGVGSISAEGVRSTSTDEEHDSMDLRWAVSASPKDLYDKIKPLAREMRTNPTPAEDHLWQRVRKEQVMDTKFRRQHPIDRFIVDFYSPKARLVIEVDGGIHDEQQEADQLRTEFLESLGLRVLRFSNGEVLQQTDGVIERIVEVLQEQDNIRPHPQPLPEYREGSQRREISKWDIFYYVYGLLHHPAYRSKFADNLKRELPRIPFAPDFWAFAEAGKKLADLHLNYETVKPYELKWETAAGKPINYRVEKMKFTKDNDLIYNDTLTLKGIPKEAFDYKLGNRSALHWIVDQYQVSTDKRSGITSDPNTYSDDERYIVNLVERVTRVSVETVAIVNGLPPLA